MGMKCWWRKIRSTWLASFGRFKAPKIGSGGGSSGGGNTSEATTDGVNGLLTLREDVQRCGYKDIEIMWNILMAGVDTSTSTTPLPPHPPPPTKRTDKKFQWKFSFWANNHKSV